MNRHHFSVLSEGRYISYGFFSGELAFYLYTIALELGLEPVLEEECDD